jgi:hypothetical protein
MDCPVCNEKLDNTYSDYLDGHILMESEHKCKHGHYYSGYTTGYSEEAIYGKLAICYGYSSPPTKLEELKYKWHLYSGKLRWKLRPAEAPAGAEE